MAVVAWIYLVGPDIAGVLMVLKNDIAVKVLNVMQYLYVVRNPRPILVLHICNDCECVSVFETPSSSTFSLARGTGNLVQILIITNRIIRNSLRNLF